MRKVILPLLVVGAVLCGVFCAANSYAASCGGVDTIIISCEDSGKAGGGIYQVLKIVIDIMTAIVGVLAVAGITIVGIQYLTAHGNEAQMTKAKRRLFEIVIGVAAYALLYGLLSFLVPSMDGGATLPDIPNESTQQQNTNNQQQNQQNQNQQNQNQQNQNQQNQNQQNQNQQNQQQNDPPKTHYAAKHELVTGKVLKYWLNVPEGATDGMPLVIFLHGTSEVNSANAVNNLPQVKYMQEYGGSTPPFISIAPVSNSASYWAPTTIRGIIDDVAKTYQSDTDRIYIWGFSLGGIGTWATVNAYPGFFAAAIPISGCPSKMNVANFVKTPVLAISGTAGVEGQTYGPCMKNFVNQINNNGGSAKKETYDGQSHATLSKALKYSELFSWMLGKSK